MNEPTIVVRVSEGEPDLVAMVMMGPRRCVLTPEEISGILLSVNRAKAHGNAEVSFTFHKMGSVVRIVKEWVLLKDSSDGTDESRNQVTAPWKHHR
jgi:hypothetical protein